MIKFIHLLCITLFFFSISLSGAESVGLKTKLSGLDFRIRSHQQNVTPYSSDAEGNLSLRFLPEIMMSIESENNNQDNEVSLFFAPLVAYRAQSKESAPLTAHKVYIQYDQKNLGLKLMAGRQEIHFREGLIFSNNRESLKPTSFDGVHATLDVWKYKGQLIYLNNQQNQMQYVSKPKEYVMGIYNTLDFNSFQFDFYYFFHENDDIEKWMKQYSMRDGKYKNAQIYGLRLEYKASFFTPLYMTGEFAENRLNSSGDHPVLYKGVGQIMDAKAGLFFKTANEIPVLKYISSSKTQLHLFKASRFYMDSFGDRGKGLGLAQLFGRRNLMGIGLRESIEIQSNFQFLLEYYSYYAAEGRYPIYKINEKQYDTDKTSEKSEVGQEFALSASYSLSKESKIEASTFIFNPGIRMKEMYGSHEQYGLSVDWTLIY